MSRVVTVMGLKDNSPGKGCILADDMGLGKTIQVTFGAPVHIYQSHTFDILTRQSIVLIWTLLKQGMDGPVPPNQPTARRVVVVTPTRLEMDLLPFKI